MGLVFIKKFMLRLYKTYFFLLIAAAACFSCQSLARKEMNAQAETGCERTIRLISDFQGPVNELFEFAPGLYIYAFKSGNIFLYRWTCNGFYHFTVWGKAPWDGDRLLLHDSIPFDEFVSDSIGLINKDLTEDLLIEGRRKNGKYHEGYAILYCNEGNKKFMHIEGVTDIPNPGFSFKGVYGWDETDSGKLQYNYEWKDRFALEPKDTVTVLR